MKVALFILGALLGINIGYVVMIPARNEYRSIAHECVDHYAQAAQELQKCSRYYKEDTLKLANDLSGCHKDLLECAQDLSLLQGRSK